MEATLHTNPRLMFVNDTSIPCCHSAVHPFAVLFGSVLAFGNANLIVDVGDLLTKLPETAERSLGLEIGQSHWDRMGR
jgi:hypothetical protein